MRLPRLVGTSTAVVDGTLYGIMEMETLAQGMPVLARRTVWLRKAGR